MMYLSMYLEGLLGILIKWIFFTNRLTRLVNCLMGFYDDIVIGISNSERISAIILSIMNGE